MLESPIKEIIFYSIVLGLFAIAGTAFYAGIETVNWLMSFAK